MDQVDPTLNARLSESAEIEQRFAASLETRNLNGAHKYSAEYRVSLPKNSIEALGISAEQEEEILFQYASTYSIQKTASLAGVGVDKVRAVIFNPTNSEPIRIFREKMRVSILAKIEDTQVALLEAIQDPHKLHSSPLRELSNVFTDITASQISLMKANQEAAGPSELQVDPSQIFSGEELEHMAYLRRRLALTPSGSNGPSGTGVDHDPMAGHDFVDPEYETVDPGYEPIPEIVDRSYDPFSDKNE